MLLDDTSYGALGTDTSYDPTLDSNPIPDTSSIASQTSGDFLGGGSPSILNVMGQGGMVSDPSGGSAINVDTGSNPNPTGGYLSTIQDILAAANKGFSTYVAGSPAAATPPAKKPGSTSTIPNVLPAGVSWGTVGVAVGVGVVALVVLGFIA